MNLRIQIKFASVKVDVDLMRANGVRYLRVACATAVVLAGVTGLAEAQRPAVKYRHVALFEVPSELQLQGFDVHTKIPGTRDIQMLYFSTGPDLTSGRFNDDDLRVGVFALLKMNNKPSAFSFVEELRNKPGVVKTTINGAPAVAMIAPTQVAIWWTVNSQEVSLIQMGRGSSLATARTLAETVSVDTNPAHPIRMKAPPKTTLKIDQTLASLSLPSAESHYLKLTSLQPDTNDIPIVVFSRPISVAGWEAFLTVYPVWKSSLGGVIESNQRRVSPTVISVNGQPGFHSDLIDKGLLYEDKSDHSNRKHVVWFDRAGQSFEVDARNDSPLPLMDVAVRVASIESDRASEIQSELEVFDHQELPVGKVVASGTVGKVKWTTQRIVQNDKICVRISIKTVTNRFCDGTTTPTLRWTSVRTNNGFAAVGLTRPDARTVVLRDATGTEISRTKTNQIAPSMASFVVGSPKTLAAASITALDATGAQLDVPVFVGA
jgi:hypothetical protein